METTLVIIRGNSGSGKTTLAQALQCGPSYVASVPGCRSSRHADES
nr:hypothetical protein [Lactiplantibacillus plantarum]